MVKCACLDFPVPADRATQISAFYELRSACAALHSVVIPDNTLTRHRAFTESAPDAANHSSVPFLAFCNGYLAQFTAPLHRFVLDESVHKGRVTQQYSTDLCEKWMFEQDELSRFIKSRSFVARWMELRFALWLESMRWTIRNLELYGANVDIDALSPQQLTVAFEVKYLAPREEVFEFALESFANPLVARLSLYSPVDYLLYRVYEAARQLRNSAQCKIVVAIVSDYSLSFKIPLSEGWIDWRQPTFLRRDSEVAAFLEKKLAGNPHLENDVRNCIRTLGEIWIFRRTDELSLRRAHRIRITPVPTPDRPERQ